MLLQFREKEKALGVGRGLAVADSSTVEREDAEGVR